MFTNQGKECCVLWYHKTILASIIHLTTHARIYWGLAENTILLLPPVHLRLMVSQLLVRGAVSWTLTLLHDSHVTVTGNKKVSFPAFWHPFNITTLNIADICKFCNQGNNFEIIIFEKLINFGEMKKNVLGFIYGKCFICFSWVGRKKFLSFIFLIIIKMTFTRAFHFNFHKKHIQTTRNIQVYYRR